METKCSVLDLARWPGKVGSTGRGPWASLWGTSDNRSDPGRNRGGEENILEQAGCCRCHQETSLTRTENMLWVWHHRGPCGPAWSTISTHTGLYPKDSGWWKTLCPLLPAWWRLSASPRAHVLDQLDGVLRGRVSLEPPTDT